MIPRKIHAPQIPIWPGRPSRPARDAPSSHVDTISSSKTNRAASNAIFFTYKLIGELRQALFELIQHLHRGIYLLNTGVRLTAFLDRRKKLAILKFNSVHRHV